MWVRVAVIVCSPSLISKICSVAGLVVNLRIHSRSMLQPCGPFVGTYSNEVVQSRPLHHSRIVVGDSYHEALLESEVNSEYYEDFSSFCSTAT